MASPITIPSSSPTRVQATSSPQASSLLHEHLRKNSAATFMRQPKALHPVDNEDLKLLLLENISQDAVLAFEQQGFTVDHHAKALSEDELLQVIGNYHAIGIRSKTKITHKVIQAASKLLVIGCFCIGVNQVDLESAAKAGIPVFNSPFSNSRSVAELVMAEVIALSRQLFERADEMRKGVWNKQSKGCWEIRGKTLGIVGYGHIGSQLSVLAESFGMHVIFFDIVNIMPLGTARQKPTLAQLLNEADFVTLHVPELPETTNLISHAQLAQMKEGSYLINNARGKVIDIPALLEVLKSGHLAGAAIDVYPAEPSKNGAPFDDQLNSWATELRKSNNVILTPHIGGSTEEAQRMIGEEVAASLKAYLNYGSTIGSVNFPEVDLRAITAEQGSHVRICYVHNNQPGVLKDVNAVLAPFNVEKQFSDSRGDVAYLMADIADVSPKDVNTLKDLISQTNASILTRLLA